ncbi:hypothetical protein CMT41_11500 [Colwellia sp. MT41]|uniref:immunoglobulin-like domain-containing protein n=1 Tax=Colwellia sp. MT41 TaxID=58049 RepID=UPI000717A3FA|nr:immunoglobulin-like domain-containing protein [Colwellia sp. MT41]ALO35277.1 hypothetical protein CMT41_11500 [Colwellia sp. MT41]
MGKISVLSRIKKNKISVQISIILATSTLVLSGCGSSTENPDVKNTVVKSAVVEVDLNPTLASGLLCIDQNNNGQCDSNEPSKADFSAGEIPEDFYSDEYSRLLELNDGSLFIAAPTTTIITAYGTIISNEILFNPTVAGDANLAASYIQEKLSLETDGSFAVDQASQLQASIKAALVVAPTAHTAKAIAAVIDEVVASETFEVTVTADQINAESIAKRDNQLSGTELTWQQSDGDETPDFIMPLAGRNLTAMTMHYHNGLMIIDTSGDTPVIAANGLFAAVDGERYEIDGVTGASEHRLRGAVASTDGQYVYINIRPRNEDAIGNDNDDKYGLFRVQINDDGSFADYNDSSVLRYASAFIGDFEIVGDKIYVEDRDRDVTLILNLDLTDTGATVAAADAGGLSNIDSQFFSPDGTYIYAITESIAADDTADPVVVAVASSFYKINVSTNEIEASFELTTSFSQLKFYHDGTKALGYLDDYATLIDLENMVLTDELPLASDVFYGEVTADNQYAIFASDSYEVWVFDLNAIDLGVSAKFVADERLRVASVDQYGNIFAAGRGFNQITKYAVGDVISPTAAIALDKAAIIAGNLYRGGSLTAIVSDLSLTAEIDGGAGSAIVWSSTTTSINTADAINDDSPEIGTVTRPHNGSGDETGILTASLSFNFRNISESASKDFAVSIRQTPASLPAAHSVFMADHSSQYMAVNYDGDISISPVKNDDDVYGFVSLKLINSELSLVSGTPSAPRIYADFESLVGVGIHKSYAVGISAALDDTDGQARIFTVALDDAGVLADTVTTSIDITTGTPLKAGFNTEQSIAAVMIEKADGSYIAEIYSLGDTGEVELSNTIEMAAADYKTYGPPAINDDASRVYQRDSENKIIMSAADGSSASATVEEIARVWYFNGFVFITDYDGNVVSFNESLDESSRQMFYTGTGGRIYGAVGRALNGSNYLFLPVQRTKDAALTGVYQLEIAADGSLTEVAFSLTTEGDGPNRMAVSGDGDTVIYSNRIRSGDNKGRWLSAVVIPTE